MMVDKNLPHIFLTNVVSTRDYKIPSSGRGRSRFPNRDRKDHAAKLEQELSTAWKQAKSMKTDRSAVSLPAKEGTYFEFRSQVGYDLVTKSLENLTQKIRLLNVKKEGPLDNQITIATVYVPLGKESYFLKEITEYAEKERHKNLLDSVEDIKLAVLESFWQDDKDLIPRDKREWCEVWLRTVKGDEEETEKSFKQLCKQLEIQYREGGLIFPERLVLLVKTKDLDLTEIIKSCDSVAEFRISKETANFWLELPNTEQSEWVQDLLDRTTINDNNVSICVIDTGANNGHPLLSNVLSNDDCHSCKPNWGVDDDDPDGHGTSMCGVAVYGDIQNVLVGSHQIEINHQLESVKMLSSKEDNPRELWGHLTSQAISRAEINNPERLRINCMAITAEDTRDRGRPSSWSAAVDALASGELEDDTKRLILISAGNIHDSDEWRSYPVSNLTYSVHDPAQAWNALTVGAMTNKVNVRDPNYSDYRPIAPYGGLSPFTTTSLNWEDNKWPIKPEVVLEGGNAGDNGSDIIDLDDLSILTTHHKYINRHFTNINATSAATAEASRLAAIIQASYPNAWPETVRALMVHSAKWTDNLKQQFGITNKSKKRDYARLLRICGYGVPDLDRALYCANNSVTLIAQEIIQPYAKKDSGSGYRTKDMHIYELPWPRKVLLDQGDLPVELRITLSYFIEPGPGEIGWKDRYRYPSFGLRFDLNTPGETRNEFLYRINAAAREELGEQTSDSGSDRWMIGKNQRNFGSIHSDIWEGTAADLATSNLVGIYPIIGWWRERTNLKQGSNKTRYSLIVSLHTPEQNIDIYTPISTAIETPIQIATS